MALRCLGRSKNKENIQKTLALALNGEVKDQDVCLPPQPTLPAQYLI